MRSHRLLSLASIHKLQLVFNDGQTRERVKPVAVVLDKGKVRKAKKKTVSMANILPRRHIHQECVGYNDRRRGGEENGWKEEREKDLGARVGRNWVWIVLFESHGGYPIETVAKLPFWETQKFANGFE